eukprot:1144857-Pelagomonas_calceolata.AAC.1
MGHTCEHRKLEVHKHEWSHSQGSYAPIVACLRPLDKQGKDSRPKADHNWPHVFKEMSPCHWLASQGRTGRLDVQPVLSKVDMDLYKGLVDRARAHRVQYDAAEREAIKESLVVLRELARPARQGKVAEV